MKKIALEVQAIRERNKKVEADKAWETSIFRKLIIAILTYFVVVLFFVVADLPQPFINAIIPAIGFVLSTLSLSVFKKFWLKYFR